MSVPFCCHPLDAILGHLILHLFHFNGVDKSLHDAVQPRDVGLQFLHGEATMWGPWVDVVVRVWSRLWGCLGLDLDVQLCDGVFDFIIVQAAVDGDRAWPFMGKPTWMTLWGAIGGEVWILRPWCTGIGTFRGDGCA